MKELPMSAVNNTVSNAAGNPASSADRPCAKLRLAPTPEMPRTLLVTWDAYGIDGIHINAHAFVGTASVAYAGAHAVNEVRLDVGGLLPPIFWLRSAQFELTAAEAAEVERVLVPLGLCVDRSEPQT